MTLNDSLDSSNLIGWNLGNGAQSTGGEIKLTGTYYWKSSFERQNKFPKGTGIVISYKYYSQPDFEIFFDVGEWAHPDYKRFGIYPMTPSPNLFEGSNWLDYYIIKNFTPAPNTWYSVLLAIGQHGNFLALIWDKDKPEHTAYYHKVIKNWDANNWRFSVGANKGMLEFDDYLEISFSGFKK